MNDLSKIKKHLENVQNKRGITQATVASDGGLKGQSTVSQFKNSDGGEAKTLLGICTALGIDIEGFIANEGNPMVVRAADAPEMSAEERIEAAAACIKAFPDDQRVDAVCSLLLTIFAPNEIPAELLDGVSPKEQALLILLANIDSVDKHREIALRVVKGFFQDSGA